MAVNQMGMPPERFWRLTPYEISMEIQRFSEQHKEREREIVTQAWMIAAFVWQKKLPKLDKLLKDIDKPTPQRQKSTDAELIEAAKKKGLKGPWD